MNGKQDSWKLNVQVRIGDTPLRFGFSAGETTPTPLALNNDLLAGQVTDPTLNVAGLTPGLALEGQEVVHGVS